MQNNPLILSHTTCVLAAVVSVAQVTRGLQLNINQNVNKAVRSDCQLTTGGTVFQDCKVVVPVTQHQLWANMRRSHYLVHCGRFRS